MKGSKTTPTGLSIELLDKKRDTISSVLQDCRSFPDFKYGDVRVEVVETRMGMAQNGQPKLSIEDHRLSVGIRVIAGDGVTAPGYYGFRLSPGGPLTRTLREGLKHAHARALANAREKSASRNRFGPLGTSLSSVNLASIPIVEKQVSPAMKRDPRTISPSEILQYLVPISSRIASYDRHVVFNLVWAQTQLRRQLFCSTEGAYIDQSYAITDGMCMVAAQGDDSNVPLRLSESTGHQCGWELMEAGWREGPIQLPDFESLSLGLARTTVEVAAAPPLKSTDKEVVVVTDPHFNTLLVHEVVGHPSELDRALKMETAYAGRSWLLKDLKENQVGQRVASSHVSAYSDASMDGYGHYLYDDEGTPALMVYHIDKGIFKEFLDSRQTAAITGATPNGSYNATEADFVPIIRMSNTVFGPGDRDPQEIIKDVESGFYVQGHRIPSVAESRENFRISCVKVYEIHRGQLGRLYRDGAVMADTKDYFLHVDASGNDFRMFPIPNCGKGQPMQTKRMSNGGPTMRSVARLVGS